MNIDFYKLSILFRESSILFRGLDLLFEYLFHLSICYLVIVYLTILTISKRLFQFQASEHVDLHLFL